jgi:hypothetical protein
MTYSKNRKNGRYMVTHKGRLNGVDYCFFAQSSSFEKAMGEVLYRFAQFEKQVKQFED